MELSEKWPEVLVCFAVKEEAAEFNKLLPHAPGRRAETLITGMGRKNSERALLQKLAARAPNLVLTCGFAGALNPELEMGDVVFDADPEIGLAEMLLAAGAAPATFYCAPRVATTAGEKTALRQSTGADVVEMESGIIRDICRRKNIPSATIRAISDTAWQDLPLDFNALMTPDETLSFSKLALALVKSPGKIPKLIELQRHTRFAAGELAKVLAALLNR